MLTNLLRTLDSFGHPISLNYKGGERHLTVFGGILSLFKFGFVLFYSVSKVQNFVLRDDPSTSKNDKFLNFRNREYMNATEIGFDFAYTLSRFDQEGFRDITQIIDETIVIPNAYMQVFDV